MRVKIAYTVELEEVESEVAEIMSRAASDLPSGTIANDEYALMSPTFPPYPEEAKIKGGSAC